MTTREATDDSKDFDISSAMEDISASLFGDKEGEGNGTGEVDTSSAGTGGTGDSAGAGDQSAAGKGDGKAATAGDPAKGGATTTTTGTGDDKGAVGGTTGTGASQPAASASAPETWRAEAQALWSQLPPVAQAEILKREQDMFRGIEGYKADASIGKALKDVVTPYLAEIRAAGGEPMQLIQNLLQAQYQLVRGTDDQRHATFASLCKQYNIDPTRLIASESDTFIDPQVAGLTKKVDSVLSWQQEQRNAAEQAARRENDQKVAAFFADPKNVHVNLVANDMTALIKAGICRTLDEAYDRAVHLNPVTRALEHERLTAEAAKAALAKTGAHAQAAAAATSANVKTNGRGGAGTETLGSMDDTMRETMRAIKARSGS